uniref:Uncharacterized protein n=1 Tax=Klebsiella pneumoniae TaxID=573 RepID=A0A2P1BNC0_KLEPN|nr:hypothetical protein [Klebsiella pneumoniae]
MRPDCLALARQDGGVRSAAQANLFHPLAGHGPEAAAFSAEVSQDISWLLAQGDGMASRPDCPKNGLPLALLLRRAV